VLHESFQHTRNNMDILNRVYKNSVEQCEIDNMGHMNVQFYVHHALNACEIFLKEKKLITWPQTMNTNFHLEEIFIRYLREQTVANPFVILATMGEISENNIIVYLEMKNLKTDVISAAFLLTFKYDFGQSRANQSLTSMKDNISDSKFSLPPHALKKGLLGQPNLNLKYQDISNNPNYIESFRGLASQKFNKQFHQLNAADYMGIISKAVPHLLLQGEHSIDETGIGGAALEYEFRFNRFVEEGNRIMLKSGLRKISQKTYNWTHWFIDQDTLEIVAVADSVIVAMDLATRKAAPIPRKMRAKLEKILIV